MKDLKKVLHRLFVPSHHNNHHPRAISHVALTAYLFLSVASFIILRNIGVQTGNVLGFATDISVDRILALTNERRAQSGLNGLTFNGQLAAAANAKAQDMFSKGYWAHFGPNGESPWNFILGSGYQYEYAGENLAKNYMISDAVMEAWMNSETHRANILNKNYKEIGIAVVNGNLSGEDTTLVVQMFGSASSTQPERLAVQNTAQATSTVEEILPTITPKEDINLVRGRIIPTIQQRKATSLRAQNIDQIVPPSGTLPQTTPAPSINLMPAFRMIASVAIVLLIVIFIVDFYHVSKTQYHKHRGKHVAHLIFLIAMLIGIYLLGRGVIL